MIKFSAFFLTEHNNNDNNFFEISDGFKWLQANKDETVPQTQYTVKGLKEEQIYEFRIAAENKAGVGPASDPTAPVQVKEPVGKYLVIIF